MFVELLNGTVGLIDNLLFYTYFIKNNIKDNLILIERSTLSAYSVPDTNIHHLLYVVSMQRASLLPIFGATLYVVESYDEVFLENEESMYKKIIRFYY